MFASRAFRWRCTACAAIFGGMPFFFLSNCLPRVKLALAFASTVQVSMLVHKLVRRKIFGYLDIGKSCRKLNSDHARGSRRADTCAFIAD